MTPTRGRGEAAARPPLSDATDAATAEKRALTAQEVLIWHLLTNKSSRKGIKATRSNNVSQIVDQNGP